ncbi:SsgA family sporulation/cell division regulator [Streptomyces sp. S.PB5]|uniref:SsgA family sporulation/cell division regulator n=1 Tax=Streptomyces sp. S.PB5 TaxID=3020844 RepID=UPI0025B1D53E|nr:SsgA family sporulation/cell division regulator [Streptomyces sp. S.PB5]MDN3026045.1 SsgA family sporulation/cell division regulator [Streptomyces sp. S.PB5]
MHTVVEQPARARLITSERQDVPVFATLRYVPADPLAVHVDFPADVSLDGRPVSWAFSRELLREGMETPAGHGDIHVWPCGRALTVLEFHSPDGMALVQFDTDVMRRFLLRTCAIVPVGQEDLGPAVDRGLYALVDG